MKQITSLNLWNNNIKDAGARTIAINLTNLTSLDLGWNNIGDEGAKAIAQSEEYEKNHINLILDVITSEMMVRRPSQNI